MYLKYRARLCNIVNIKHTIRDIAYLINLAKEVSGKLDVKRLSGQFNG